MSTMNITKKLENLVVSFEKRSARISDCADLSSYFDLPKKYEDNRARADAYADAAAQLRALLKELEN